VGKLSPSARPAEQGGVSSGICAISGARRPIGLYPKIFHICLMKELFPFYSIAHFINEPASQTDFEILHFEKMKEPEVDEIHKHSFYEIIWIENGKSRQTIDYAEYEILPNSLFFISPNQVHQFEEWKPLKGGSILFTEDFFLLNNYNKEKLFEVSFLDNLYSSPCIQLSGKEFTEIKSIIDQISIESKRKDKSKTILQSFLHILIAKVERNIDKKSGKIVAKRNLIIYKQFKTLLELHFKENKSVEFYAGRLTITSHHLNLVIKKVTGKTATGVIRQRSILEAKRLLTFSDDTISQIAMDLNYFDSSYFAKMFKAETGLSPNGFKQTMSEKYRIK
jgi:AraC family transcriptional regulator, transcriptional activator of pobA